MTQDSSQPAATADSARSEPVAVAPLEAVVFDLGMVLVEIDFSRSFATWAGHAGVEPGALAARYRADEAYERHERGELDGLAYLELLGSQLGVDLTPAQWTQGWVDLLLEPVRGIEALVDALDPRLKKAVFSNTNATHAAVFEARYGGLLARFDRVFLSHELGMRKPERRAFERVAAELGVAPQRVLFLDDNEANIAGAGATGMRTVLVRSIDDTRRGLASAGALSRG